MYDNPTLYDARKLKPLEAYLESLWKPICRDLATQYIHNNDILADFGCGTLAHMSFMSHAKLIYAVDANKKMLEFGLHKLSNEERSRLIPLHESAIHTSIPSHICSVIWSIGLTEYVSIDELFAEMTRVAQPDAVMLIQFPNAYNIVHIAIRIVHTLLGTHAKKYRTKSEIQKIAKKYGWSTTQSITTGFYIPVPGIFISLLSPIWKLFNAFGNNTFLVLRKSNSE